MLLSHPLSLLKIFQLRRITKKSVWSFYWNGFTGPTFDSSLLERLLYYEIYRLHGNGSCRHSGQLKERCRSGLLWPGYNESDESGWYLQIREILVVLKLWVIKNFTPPWVYFLNYEIIKLFEMGMALDRKLNGYLHWYSNFK